MTLLDQYKSACNFPGIIDVPAVEKSLAAYCQALGVKRNIVKIERGWDLSTYPELTRTMHEILTDFEERSGRKKTRDALGASDASDALGASDASAALDARDARDALDALDARDALGASDALAARDASAALDARAARAARAARDALDALGASDALAARDASAALDARAARAARAARDALDALDALAASDASDARDALAALDARDARDARDASDASAALAASDASAALDALDARDARDARAARDASAASDALAASDASDALGASDASAALDARDARDALDARAARDALDALDALAALDALGASDALAPSILMKKFAEWCIYRRSWWWYGELSWLSTTHVGAIQINKQSITNWTQPMFDAYMAGAWLIVWTKETLYWVEKPTVITEPVDFGRGKRLHNATGPSLRCDVENLYFWHGVLVPAFVVLRPDWITIKHIETEHNAEVRRVMIDRYGAKKYLEDSGAAVVQEMPADHPIVGLRTARLLHKEVPGDETIVMIDVLNSTPEPDGTTKRYQLRIDPNCYGGAASRDCVAAIASTWRLPDGSLVFKQPSDYVPMFES